MQHGSYINNRILLLYCNCQKRSDESFHNRDDTEHHKSPEFNILELSQFPMVSGFILDEMHLCFLGVTKRVINYLFNKKLKQKTVRLGSRARKIVNK